jgi:3-hydroxymyristoyl/3-hydroxydecanoyl-(acyl carrier protein) dehydratase
MAEIRKTYPSGLPATQGHFPGNPIVPGAWLLADALASVALDLKRDPAQFAGSCTVKAAKFLAPCRPGDELRIAYTLLDTGALKLECNVGQATVLSALLICPPSPQTPA